MPRLSDVELEEILEEIGGQPEALVPSLTGAGMEAESSLPESGGMAWDGTGRSDASLGREASVELGSDFSASEPLTQPGFTVDIPECSMVSPLSSYDPFEAGAPVMSEPRALAALAPAWKLLGSTDDIEYDLDEFAAYCDSAAYPCEMRPLHQLDTKLGVRLYFDGILSIGGQQRVFVKRVPIAAMPIGNYGTQHDTAQGHVWLQSDLNRNRSIYYRLGKPAREYLRFYQPMLWVFDLAKHFVDYLQVAGDASKSVQIHHFRGDFVAWLERTQKSSFAFDAWRSQHPSSDFRTAVVAHINFLHKEAVGVLGYESTYAHGIWSEALLFTSYEPQPKSADPKTVVTQYIYDLFKDMPFGDQLTVAPLGAETQELRDRLIRERRMELPSPLHDAVKNVSTAAGPQIRNIKPGDTISTPRDTEASGSLWKREISKGFHDVDRWFALVQSVRTMKSGKRVFDVIWYYRPVETLCGVMHYPWNNELFLSDHCSCKERNKISENEVLGVHDVDFGGSSATDAELFCRQTYVHAERKWVTLREEHRHCKHTTAQRRPAQYRPGDTLLVHVDTKSELAEPCELVTSYREDDGKIYRLRRLLRRRDVDEGEDGRAAPPNELVYSSCLIEGRENRIVGRCRVRFFPAGAHIPTPYDRDGVGGYFFISCGTTEAHDGVQPCEPLDEAPPSLRQGWDPAEAVPQLRGVDLFCGGGNFGRGLEDGGGIQMGWANDYDAKALHTYMANVEVPGQVEPFLGSIDDMQRRAMAGGFGGGVPRVGDVDFVSAGSPCPGFSRLTNDKTTVAQRKNQSLVAAFGSFVDLYRPRYALLENVPGIVHKRANRDQDVFSQLICAVVGLGYQARFFFLDASSCGSPQRRSRVFLALAAPGCQLPDKPLVTHSHPPLTKSLGLGMLPMGESMAEREMPRATPFPFVTALEATKDLPVIDDAKPDTCVPFPDHRVSMGLTRAQRIRIALIPTHPWGMNFARAWYGAGKKPGSGILTPAERAFFSGTDSPSGPGSPINDYNRVGEAQANSNSYGRMYPDRLIETIVTTQNPRDGKNGRSLHWSEDRVLTIMEARRAQGVRDNEVLLGAPATQYKIVGNSVAREVAVALGIVFREAWVETLRGDHDRDEEHDAGREGTTEETASPAYGGDDTTDQPEHAADSRGSSLAPPPPPPPARKRSQSLAVEMSRRKRRRSETPGGRASSSAAPSPLGMAVMTHDDDSTQPT
ncbi:AAC(3) family N-acetyltransferase [Purpureocillium lavendulum]|uniref:DNA (cytosine-5-)-methyltransferase n=1 Tax=Purpureocillium lavendulum TaxID=1247861 RepID=A0AB34FPF6_9HYPO|nr:AAC(3) family N-acetyltransferase [Purpureocillium lavendulum]